MASGHAGGTASATQGGSAGGLVPVISASSCRQPRRHVPKLDRFAPSCRSARRFMRSGLAIIKEQAREVQGFRGSKQPFRGTSQRNRCCKSKLRGGRRFPVAGIEEPTPEMQVLGGVEVSSISEAGVAVRGGFIDYMPGGPVLFPTKSRRSRRTHLHLKASIPPPGFLNASWLLLLALWVSAYPIGSSLAFLYNFGGPFCFPYPYTELPPCCSQGVALFPQAP